METDDGREVRTGKAVEGAEGGAVPEAAKFRDGLGELVEAAEQFDGAETGSGSDENVDGI